MSAAGSNKAKTQVKQPEPTRPLLPMLHYWRKKETNYPEILIINLTACIIIYIANNHTRTLRIKSVGLFLKCMHAPGHVTT